LLPQVFASYASCAEAKATLLGVPYEFYSLALFVGLGGVAGLLLFRPPEAGGD
jgi:disulfide bond formation protein DsbB